MLDSASLSEVAVPRVCNVNPARRSCRNELDGNSLRYDLCFIPKDVHVAATRIHKPHPVCVEMGLAVGIIPFVAGHCSLRNNDQAFAGVRMPAGASSGLPNIALHVQV